MNDDVQVGLSLSGGGSKGAYQAGMAKALAEFHVPVQEVAGASVGALNGAVLASAGSLNAGAKTLERFWLDEAPFFLRLIISGVSERLGQRAVTKLLPALKTTAAKLAPPVLSLLNDDGLLSQKPLRRLLHRCLDKEALAQGLPLYVSVYDSWGSAGDLLHLLTSELGFSNTPKSTFKHLQALPDNERIECLLASMALPIIFGNVEVQGKRYSDGGQGGWQTRQGNTPVEPLIRAGCNLVIVMHTTEGSSWRRRDYPDDITFIEIRPQHEPPTMPFADLFETNKNILSSWICQGYEDARKTLDRVFDALQVHKELSRSKQELAEAERIRLEAERAAEARTVDSLEDFKRRI